MWFKNLQIFCLQDDFKYDAEILETKLSEFALKPCGATQPFSVGWVSPFGNKSTLLVHAANGCFMIAACREERVLPASVVREMVQEKVASIEDAEGRKIYSKEKSRIRDDITFELLPQAFCKKQLVFAYIDPRNKFIIIDSASRPRAEELTELLRKSLGSLKIYAPETHSSGSSIMTNWLKQGGYPDKFTIENYCDMHDKNNVASKIKCQNLDLFSKEVQNHLAAGKMVASLGLTWRDKLSFVLDENLAIKRIKYLDIIEEQAEEVSIESEIEKHDVDFAIMSAEFTLLLADIYDAFGGINPPKSKEPDIEQQLETAVEV